MNPINPFFSLIIYIIAFFTGYIIKSIHKITFPQGRHESIEGLRGFLALGVFIHHSALWSQFIKNGKWEVTGSNLYIHFGQTSVSFFFMITSFLFISKLLNSNKKGFNWRDFFISRFYRLIPMYYFSLLVIIFSIMFISQWQFKTGIIEFLVSIFHWGIFTIIKSPMINNIFTPHINAGIVWSLPYEWLFYFSLPLISIFLKIKPKKIFILISVCFIIGFCIVHEIVTYHILSFIGGSIAPFLLKYTSFYKKIKDSIASFIIIVCLILIVQFNTSQNILCILLTTIVFTLIALGNSFFGLLKNSTLKFLGEICYSTYLIHGIILFEIFYFVFGLNTIEHLSPLQYCLLIFSITPIIIIISYLGFKYIEKPFMDKSKKIIQKLNSV